MGVYAGTGRCVMANIAYAELVGAAPAELLAQDFRAIDAWRRTGLLENCLAALADHCPQQREIRAVTSFGKELWLDCRILPIHFKGEDHLLLKFIDLTERKHTEHALRESEARNKALIGALPDLILTINRHGELLSIHEPPPGLNLIAAQNPVHRKIAELLPATVADEFMAAIEKVLIENNSQELEFPLPCDGRENRYFDAKFARYGADAVVAIVRDTTEQERDRRRRELQRTVHLTDRLQLTEEELLKSQQMLALAADAAHLGIWQREIDSGEIWASQYWRSMFGFSQTQLITMESLLQRVHSADRQTFDKTISDAVRKARPYELTFRI